MMTLDSGLLFGPPCIIMQSARSKTYCIPVI